MSISPGSTAPHSAALAFRSHIEVPTSDSTLAVLASLLDAGRAFFEGPRDERQRHACPEKTLTGYRPVGVEYSQSPDRPDLNETFCYRKADDVTTEEGASRLIDSALIDACRAAHAVLDPLAQMVLNDMGAALANAVLSPVGTDDESWLQLNWSRPASAGREFIQDAHEDGHLITFLFADAQGLEVLVPPSGHGTGTGTDSDWQAVFPGPDSLICFAGECGSLLTADAVAPMLHRVRARPDVPSRLSVAYFVNPNLNQVLKPWVNSPRNRGVDLLSWGQQNPARFGLPTL
jgi:isopenicillin N synthase-like dioxygenase